MTTSPTDLDKLAGVLEPASTAIGPPNEAQSHEILREEIRRLNERKVDMDIYRDYYEGEQTLIYGTPEFKEKYGEEFTDFRDNWSKVVVDAVVHKLRVEGLSINEDINAELADETGTDPDTLARDIWTIFQRNNWDEQQDDLHQGAQVEGRASVIVWPDREIGARVDWNPGQNVSVRYDDEERRVAWAVKRWLTDSGSIRVNLYLPDRVEKYRETSPVDSFDPTISPFRQRIANSSSTGYEFIEMIPNLLGEVPVVEFLTRSGSALKDVIPQQDAINYLMVATLIGSGLAGWPQRVFMSNLSEPTGGWRHDPGKIWELPHSYDADGNPIMPSIGEFSAANLDPFVNIIQESLRHVAATSSTPMRLFFQSDRSGRGDAASGESLRVDDEPLIDKVESLQRVYGNGHYKVARLVAKASKLYTSTPFPVGEPYWRDPQARQRSVLLQDAKVMKEIGIPFDFIVGELGLSPLTVKKVLDMREELSEDRRDALDGIDLQPKPSLLPNPPNTP